MQTTCQTKQNTKQVQLRLIKSMILVVTATSTYAYADSSNMQPALRGGAVVADFVQELAQVEDSHGCNPSTGFRGALVRTSAILLLPSLVPSRMCASQVLA
jgi:hypothetical protein